MQIPQSPKSFWVKHQRWKHHGVLLTSSYRPTVAKAVWYWHGIRHKDRRPKTGYLGRSLHSYSHPGFIFVCLVVFNNLSPPLFSSDSWQNWRGKKKQPSKYLCWETGCPHKEAGSRFLTRFCLFRILLFWLVR